MTKIVKYLILILSFLVLLGIAWYSGYKYEFVKTKKEIKQDVILQQIKNVLKLGTVEGSFSEIYDFKEHYAFDVSPFQKKALLRIKAVVLVGFEMDSISIKILDNSKTVVISGIPNPKILSIDHDLDYYDITEGTFNTFSKDDYNKMNAQAKAGIENVAKRSNLFDNAKIQLNEHLNLLKTLLTSYGWKLQYNYKSENVSPEFVH